MFWLMCFGFSVWLLIGFKLSGWLCAGDIEIVQRSHYPEAERKPKRRGDLGEKKGL